MKGPRDKDPRGLTKEELLIAEALPDSISEKETKVYFSGKLHGVNVAIDGEGLSAVYLLSAITKAAVELYNGENKKED